MSDHQNSRSVLHMLWTPFGMVLGVAFYFAISSGYSYFWPKDPSQTEMRPLAIPTKCVDGTVFEVVKKSPQDEVSEVEKLLPLKGKKVGQRFSC